MPLSRPAAHSPQLVNDNIFVWKVALIVTNPDSLYYGGYFVAKMTFPHNYPYSPPGKFRHGLLHAAWR
jgi:ubiquitin-conjugating enzyme E2 R